MALLELMGRTAQRPIADFFGGRVRENIPVYVASSKRGLGYLDVVRFASFTPNIGDFMEFKGNTDLPVACETSSLKCECGEVRCPTGPGFGVTVDPAYVKKARAVGSGA